MRAQIEKEAAAREAKEDAEREKRQEQEARGARKLQRKAEALAQRERVQAEVDAAAEERTRRQAKEAACAAAEARLAMEAERAARVAKEVDEARVATEAHACRMILTKAFTVWRKCAGTAAAHDRKKHQPLRPGASPKSEAAPSPTLNTKPLPPLPPLPPTYPDSVTFTEEDVDNASVVGFSSSQQWNTDYRNQLTIAQWESQSQWNAQSGWATNRESWFAFGGYDYINQQTTIRQQHDHSRATFQANFKHMTRVQHLQHKQSKLRSAREWEKSVKQFDQKMAALEVERARVSEMDLKIAELERKRAAMHDRAVARQMQIDEDEAATEADRARLSFELCARLQHRPEAGSSISLTVNECCLCFDAPCTHISTACLHVIGCETCCVKHRAKHGNICPICRSETTFGAMLYP